MSKRSTFYKRGRGSKQSNSAGRAFTALSIFFGQSMTETSQENNRAQKIRSSDINPDDVKINSLSELLAYILGGGLVIWFFWKISIMLGVIFLVIYIVMIILMLKK